MELGSKVYYAIEATANPRRVHLEVPAENASDRKLGFLLHVEPVACGWPTVPEGVDAYLPIRCPACGDVMSDRAALMETLLTTMYQLCVRVDRQPLKVYIPAHFIRNLVWRGLLPQHYLEIGASLRRRWDPSSASIRMFEPSHPQTYDQGSIDSHAFVDGVELNEAEHREFFRLLRAPVRAQRAVALTQAEMCCENHRYTPQLIFSGTTTALKSSVMISRRRSRAPTCPVRRSWFSKGKVVNKASDWKLFDAFTCDAIETRGSTNLQLHEHSKEKPGRLRKLLSTKKFLCPHSKRPRAPEFTHLRRRPDAEDAPIRALECVEYAEKEGFLPFWYQHAKTGAPVGRWLNSRRAAFDLLDSTVTTPPPGMNPRIHDRLMVSAVSSQEVYPSPDLPRDIEPCPTFEDRLTCMSNFLKENGRAPRPKELCHCSHCRHSDWKIGWWLVWLGCAYSARLMHESKVKKIEDCLRGYENAELWKDRAVLTDACTQAALEWCGGTFQTGDALDWMDVAAVHYKYPIEDLAKLSLERDLDGPPGTAMRHGLRRERISGYQVESRERHHLLRPSSLRITGCLLPGDKLESSPDKTFKETSSLTDAHYTTFLEENVETPASPSYLPNEFDATAFLESLPTSPPSFVRYEERDHKSDLTVHTQRSNFYDPEHSHF